MSPTRGSSLFLLIIFSLFLLSAGVTYYRYMVRQNFSYFTTEDQIPDQFDASSYQTL